MKIDDPKPSWTHSPIDDILDTRLCPEKKQRLDANKVRNYIENHSHDFGFPNLSGSTRANCSGIGIGCHQGCIGWGD